MAKKVDPFEKFKAVTLGSSPQLSNAINTKSETPVDHESVKTEDKVIAESTKNEAAIPEKVSKNADRELVSFHLDKSLKKRLGLLKYEVERSFGDLYIEAIEDLLKKYNR